MMKRLTILGMLLQLPALAALGESKEGSCQLTEGNAFDKGVFTVQVGEKIKGTCKLYVMEFFRQKVINANVEIVNTSDKAMYCHFYVAFFDEHGTLIGCAGQGTFGEKGLAAGQSTQFGSCFIPLPAGLHEKAVQYKIAFYESDQEIGKAASKVRTRGTSRRKWTDATGKHAMEAELVEATGGTVRLKTENGRIISLPLEKLSDADQRYVRKSRHFGKDASVSNPAIADKLERPQRGVWFSVGPGWKELEKLAQRNGHGIQSFNHSAEHYQTILSKSKSGSTIVLLLAFDQPDKNIPEKYQYLLPLPWAQIDAAITKGETVECQGTSQGRTIVLLAAPTESRLNRLIQETKLLAQ